MRHIVHQNFDGSSIERNFKSDAKPAESVAKPAVKLPIGRGFQVFNVCFSIYFNYLIILQTRSTVQTKTNRRMDFSAEDLVFNSNERQTAHDHPNQKRRNRVRKQNVAKTNSQEQELISTAESASFVKSAKQLNGYNYPVPDKTEAPIDTSVVTEKADKVTGYDYPTPDRLAKKLILPSTEPTNNPTYPTSVPKQKKNNYMAEPKPFNTRPTEKTEIYTSTFARLRVAETTNPSPIASR